MKINGSLVFDASSASEVKNLRIEKFTTGSFPLHGSDSANVGRVIYNSQTGIMYIGSATAWVAIATGGDASALLAEVDAIEASLGGMVNSSGVFVASALTGTLSGATSVTNVIEKLQALAAANGAAVAAEVTRATAAEGVNAAATAAEAVTARAAEGKLTSDLASEVSRATTAEGVLTSSVSAEVTRATAAEGVLTSELSNEVSRATSAEVALGGRVDVETAARIAEDVILQSAITAEAATARGQELAISNALSAEVTRATTADTKHTADIAAEVAARAAADTALSTAISNETARATSAETTIVSDFNARIQGLTWKNPVRVASTSNLGLDSAPAAIDGVNLVTGDLVLLKNQTAPSENGIYVFGSAGGAFVRAVDMDIPAEFNSATVYVREGSTQADLGYTQTAEVLTVGTDTVSFIQFNGAGSVGAGDGLSQSGNIINVGTTDGSITVSPDSIAVSSALQTAISNNTSAIAAETVARENKDVLQDEANVKTAADAAAALAAEVTARIADVNVEEARAIAAEGVLTGLVSAEATRATAAEGVNAAATAAEAVTARAAEAALSASLSGEITRATAAEGVLTASVSAEVSRAEAAEAAIVATANTQATRVNNMYYVYSGAASAVHGFSHAVGSMYCNVTVVDELDEVVIPQSIKFDSNSHITVTFNTPIACKIVVMGSGLPV
jgi:hypothetical protein